MVKRRLELFTYVTTHFTGLSGIVGLRSTQRGHLAVRKTPTELGKHSFRIAAAAAIWNTLPDNLRSLSISKGQFLCGTKTHLFQQGYNHWEPRFKSVSDWTELSWNDVESLKELLRLSPGIDYPDACPLCYKLWLP